MNSETLVNNLNPDVAKMSSGIQLKGWNGKNEGGIFRQTGSADKSHMLFTVNTTNDVAMVINENRNVGIGITAPTSKLEVNGAATNTVALNAAAATTIDFALSNLAYTSATANTITLSNLKDGGAYSLVFTSTAVNTAVTFSATGFTFKYMGTGVRTTGKAHIYSFIVAGTVVYVSMSTEN